MSDTTTGAALPFAEIIVIDDTDPHPAALNMALDEVLLLGLGASPILRFYRWQDRSVSFGYFGKITSVRRDHPGTSLVRRWTGGGLVEHDGDFTFTLLVPRRFTLAVLPARESYRLIHTAVASAMALTGFLKVVSAGSVDLTVHGEPQDAPFLKPCFANPVMHDLLLDGRKVAGGAQRRSQHGLLHQGSIQGFMRDGLPDDSRHSGLGKNLAATIGQKIISRPVSTDEIERAASLAAAKYATAAWMKKF